MALSDTETDRPRILPGSRDSMRVKIFSSNRFWTSRDSAPAATSGGLWTADALLELLFTEFIVSVPPCKRDVEGAAADCASRNQCRFPSIEELLGKHPVLIIYACRHQKVNTN